MSYIQEQRKLAVAWKARTSVLPDGAKTPAPYVDKDGQADGRPLDVCLPPTHASWNLLPDVRNSVLALFADLEIPWHAGVAGGPSNHLLSSQVQCANALAGMVTVSAPAPAVNVSGMYCCPMFSVCVSEPRPINETAVMLAASGVWTETAAP